jgi:hypothetical protein
MMTRRNSMGMGLMLKWIFFRLRLHITTVFYSLLCGLAAYGFQDAISAGQHGHRFLYILPAIIAAIMGGVSNWSNDQVSNSVAFLFLGEKLLAAYLAFGIAYGGAALISH